MAEAAVAVVIGVMVVVVVVDDGPVGPDDMSL